MLTRTLTTGPITFTERLVTILAVPFGQAVTVDDGAGPYREAFSPMVDVEQLRDRLPALLHHDPRRPFGHVESITRTPAGLHASIRAARTADGDEALELAAAGVLFPSIGFTSTRDRAAAGVTWRDAIVLHEISLVTFQAYPGAAVTAVRDTDPRPRQPKPGLAVLDAILRDARGRKQQ
jgi:HK97 family phage prohead protease